MFAVSMSGVAAYGGADDAQTLESPTEGSVRIGPAVTLRYKST